MHLKPLKHYEYHWLWDKHNLQRNARVSWSVCCL